MRLKHFALSLALIGLAQLGVGASSARAGLLLNFGQTPNTNTLTGTKLGDTAYSLVGTDIPVQITQIDPSTGLTAPISAYLNVNMNSTEAAGSVAGIANYQKFAGSIKLTGGTGGTGINYLSTTTLSGLVVGIDSAGSASLGSSPGGVGFSSDVFGTLTDPMSISLQLGNVTPTFALDGNSLASFTASVTGTASAAIPEPSSIVAATIGLIVLAPAARRRFRSAC